MKPIRTIKRVVAGALSAGATLFIAACYGPMEPDYELARGSVDVPAEAPSGLQVQVCAKLQQSGDLCTGVWDGQYDLRVFESALDDAQLHGYRLCAGDTGGVLVEECVDVPANSGIVTRDFSLELSLEK
jgi:hypothetical protein